MKTAKPLKQLPFLLITVINLIFMLRDLFIELDHGDLKTLYHVKITINYIFLNILYRINYIYEKYLYARI